MPGSNCFAGGVVAARTHAAGMTGGRRAAPSFASSIAEAAVVAQRRVDAGVARSRSRLSTIHVASASAPIGCQIFSDR